MKKLMLMLMVLAMAAPLYAAGEVTFVATDNKDGTCTITFDANDIFDIQPVAMGIDVKVNGSDSSHLITAVSGIDSFFDIFMDAAYSIQSDPCDPCYPYDYGEGTPIADPCGPGEIALPSHNFTVSMGGLGGESGELASAPDNGTAFILTAGNLNDPCVPVTGHIKVNARRGGVIGNDTEPMVTNLHLNFTISVEPEPVECVKSTAPFYQAWLGTSAAVPEAGASWDKPDCWCFNRNCRGDVNGAKLGPYWVQLADLQLFKTAYLKVNTALPPGNTPTLTPTGGICSDFNHAKLGPYHVQLADLTIFKAYYTKIETLVPCCDNDIDCVLDVTDVYNFWTN